MGLRPDPDAPETENERFKRTLSPAVRVGVLAAIAVHVLLVALAPSFGAAEPARPFAPLRMDIIATPPRVSIPAAPEPVARPARPDLATPAVARTLSVEAPPVAANLEPVARTELAPPPVPATRAADRPPYIPFEVAPTLKNRQRAATLLQQVYPASLRESGVSGSVLLWLYIDAAGIVRDCQIAESSGYEELDLAAQTVAYAMEFTPAKMRDRPTAVWISQPIDFIAK